jgi:hypothetical protein
MTLRDSILQGQRQIQKALALFSEIHASSSSSSVQQRFTRKRLPVRDSHPGPFACLPDRPSAMTTDGAHSWLDLPCAMALDTSPKRNPIQWTSRPLRPLWNPQQPIQCQSPQHIDHAVGTGDTKIAPTVGIIDSQQRQHIVRT